MESQLTLHFENANKEQFENWLNDYTRNVSARVFPHGVDKHFIVGNIPIWKTNSWVEIDYTYDDPLYFVEVSHLYEDGSESEKQIIDSGRLLLFRLLPIGNGLRININPSEGVEFFPYVKQLLEQLGQDWPGASQPVNEYINQLAKHNGIEIPEQSNRDSEMELPIQSQRKVVLKARPAGRKIDPWNPIAWEMIKGGNEKESAWNDAFKYWCKEKGINPESADKYDRDAFKKAMGRAKERDEIRT